MKDSEFSSSKNSIGKPVRMAAKPVRMAAGFVGIGFCSIILAFGIVWMGVIVVRGYRQVSTDSWPSTIGEIVGNDVRLDRHSRMKFGMKSSPITYEYLVDGKTYRSTVVVFVDNNNLDFDDWIELANGFSKSGNVEVFYNPKRVSESVLRTGYAYQSWRGIEFGAFIAGFACVMMVVWWALTNWLPEMEQKRGQGTETGMLKKD